MPLKELFVHLYIAYKNYSSWSLRPWILMKVAGINFDETIFAFAHNDQLERFAKEHRVPPQVPILIDNDRTIWDSLSVCEYLADTYPNKQLWPKDARLKALARSACAEMHSGFMALRNKFPMNCRVSKSIKPSPEVTAECQRLAELWALFAENNTQSGEFLCGHFSIVDAMYAPVMWRISGYNLKVSPAFERWSQAMKALPAMQQWLAEAKAETWSMPHYEVNE
jgi:glutathione S-transferase